MTRIGEQARQAPMRPKSKAAEIEERVRKALAQRQTVTRDVESEYEEKVSFGEHLADMVAEFGGSWMFIIVFAAIMGAWMLLNSIFLRGGAFDPYPYILLNLVLSTLAAIQAPIIMMSQNRQAAKDRARSEHQYEINLKSEIEIGEISRRIEEMTGTRWRELIEAQRRQIEYLERLLGPGRTGSA
jgi:uncharacterized membrane protein